MRVLYVNHTATMAGAEQSLLVLLDAVSDRVDPLVACPEGELAETVRARGYAVRPIVGSALSARLHPAHTPREVARIGHAAQQLNAIARQGGCDLIHANGSRSGLMCIAAGGRPGRLPLVVHIRDRVPPGRAPRSMVRLLARRAHALVPIARYLGDELAPLIPRRRPPLVDVIPNAIDSDRFDPDRVARDDARAKLGLPASEPVIGLVGQFSPHKGQLEAIEILSEVRTEHPTAQLVLIGSVRFASRATRFDNRAYERELHQLVAERGLGSAVHFLGERPDVSDILGACDLTLVPSWYEPFGRVALEGMALRIPVLVTSEGGTTEVVRDGIDGLVLPPREPRIWSRAVSELLSDPDRRREMGRHGRERAVAEFGTAAHGHRAAALYQRLTAAAAGG